MMWMAQRVAYLTGFSTSVCVHHDELTAYPSEPCLSLIIRLGLYVEPLDMAVVYW